MARGHAALFIRVFASLENKPHVTKFTSDIILYSSGRGEGDDLSKSAQMLQPFNYSMERIDDFHHVAYFKKNNKLIQQNVICASGPWLCRTSFDYNQRASIFLIALFIVNSKVYQK